MEPGERCHQAKRPGAELSQSFICPQPALCRARTLQLRLGKARRDNGSSVESKFGAKHLTELNAINNIGAANVPEPTETALGKFDELLGDAVREARRNELILKKAHWLSPSEPFKEPRPEIRASRW